MGKKKQNSNNFFRKLFLLNCLQNQDDETFFICRRSRAVGKAEISNPEGGNDGYKKSFYSLFRNKFRLKEGIHKASFDRE